MDIKHPRIRFTQHPQLIRKNVFHLRAPHLQAAKWHIAQIHVGDAYAHRPNIARVAAAATSARDEQFWCAILIRRWLAAHWFNKKSNTRVHLASTPKISKDSSGRLNAANVANGRHMDQHVQRFHISVKDQSTSSCCQANPFAKKRKSHDWTLTRQGTATQSRHSGAEQTNQTCQKHDVHHVYSHMTAIIQKFDCY